MPARSKPASRPSATGNRPALTELPSSRHNARIATPSSTGQSVNASLIPSSSSHSSSLTSPPQAQAAPGVPPQAYKAGTRVVARFDSAAEDIEQDIAQASSKPEMKKATRSANTRHLQVSSVFEAFRGRFYLDESVISKALLSLLLTIL